MTISWKTAFVAICISIACSAGLADDTNTNSAVVTRVDLTPVVSNVTYNITVTNAEQPVVILVSGSNDISSVVNSLWLIADSGHPNQSFQVKPVPGVSGNPHKLELTLPVGKYRISLVDKSFSASPRYTVVTEGVTSSVNVGLAIKNESPNPLVDAFISFQGGGILWKSTGIHIDPGFTGIVPITDVSVPVKLPLAYWANAADFEESKAKATLQFPMKGNWPGSLIIPGPIHFRFQSTELPPFNLTGTPAEQAFKFQAEIALDAHQFTDMPVEVTSNQRFDNVSTKDWPSLNYEKILTYSTTDSRGAVVRVDGKPFFTANSVEENRDSATLQLFVFPGQENSNHLSQLNNTLAASLIEKHPALPPISKMLKDLLPVLVTQETRRDELLKSHAVLVNTAASPEDIATSRAKLNQAKAAVSALVESFNAWVMAHPG